MKHRARAVLFFITFVAGIASLLASMPPPPYLYATTLNNFGDRQYERPIYACQGETITLSWDSTGGSTLSAEPPESFAPPLTERHVEDFGTLEVTVQGSGEVRLEDGNGGDFLDIALVPEALCTGFDFPLVGWYEGMLEQSAPTAEALPRQLALYVEAGANAEDTTLYIAIGEDVSYSGRFAPCTLDTAARQLNCAIEYEDGSGLEVQAQLTAQGLSGDYSGVSVEAGSVIPFAGTLSFDKQPRTPPTDRLDEGSGERSGEAL